MVETNHILTFYDVPAPAWRGSQHGNTRDALIGTSGDGTVPCEYTTSWTTTISILEDSVGAENLFTKVVGVRAGALFASEAESEALIDDLVEAEALLETVV